VGDKVEETLGLVSLVTAVVSEAYLEWIDIGLRLNGIDCDCFDSFSLFHCDLLHAVAHLEGCVELDTILRVREGKERLTKKFKLKKKFYSAPGRSGLEINHHCYDGCRSRSYINVRA